MEHEELIQEINKNMALSIPAKISLDEMIVLLSDYVNELIKKDFQRLVMLLYRIDISEPKLKALLQQNPQQDAGKIIASLIIERQLQKIKSRKQFNQPDNDIAEDEKW